ncbi:hypothetical protein [Vibrio vulnificus]|uniref:hypothetical protein n=1 Tax=Vibrio vulnificus TaxID=672 RepID=UPI001CDC3305|nr:hypothetical protein [Vibrio vulnificus]MCA3944530.1 hypothetical protein [Vibrio vulnificus]
MTISNEEKIYNELAREYSSEIKSITELSYNSDQNKQFIESQVTGLDFDNVKNCHPNCPKLEKSPDALFYFNQTLYFIEFKEGKSEKSDIRLKIHEALVTLYNYIVDKKIEISRDQFFELNIRYAVVFRPKKTKNRASFATTLDPLAKKYELQNLEGFLIKKTKVAHTPQGILDLLNKVTGGQVNNIIYHNRNNNNIVVTI